MEEGLRRPVSRDHMNQSLSENWLKRRPRSAVTDSQHGGGSKGHSSSSVQPSNSPQTDTTRKEYTPEHTGKTELHRPEPFSHNRRINRRSADTTKRGYRGSRPSTAPDVRRKSGVMSSSTFEVKLSDFPELCNVTSSNPKAAFIQEPRTCWGAGTSADLQDSIGDQNICQNMDTPGKKGPKQKSTKQVTSTEKCEKTLTSSSGHDSVLELSNPYGSPMTSWANIASQPPKFIQKSPATHEESTQSQQQAEQAAEKKKKKKKKKSKAASEGLEQQIDVHIQQEPPKFEDEEEFPDLTLTLVNPHKGSRPTSNPAVQDSSGMSEKELSSLQPGSVNKSKAPPEKLAPTDSKKVQSGSQKKSKAPVQLDLGNMLAVLKQKQQSQKSKQDVKPITFSVGGALPVVQKEPVVHKKHPWQQERIAHNPLDSTCPLVKKGKQREVPKAKKPTPLKRVILKEREERKQSRLQEERDPARMTSGEDQTEADSSQNAEEASESLCKKLAHDLDLTEGEHAIAEETDQTSLQDVSTDITAEENALSEGCNLDSNPSRPKIHSRKFREYCSQMLSKDVDECVTTLLKVLVRFQDRLYQKDPMKARMKRRLVMGLREVLKHLKLRKVKCVIISPNCERVQSKGGLDEALHTIIDTCREQSVPFVFALSRKSLGRCVNKAVPVSLVGIFNYDGAQDHYHKMIELTSQARKAYEVMIANLEVTSQEEQGEENERAQNTEPPAELLAAEEPEYIKIWKNMLEKDCNHKFLAFKEQFSSVAISTDSDTLPDDHDGS
ncbi:selenocysteine insertion sequence-binding protein 2 isoform X2 [Pygocentrus nattereri]|uniref:Ribosomal protein eL8/eL30/eS12/Gadd45 domain-containing protein n=1 Tax=Pygocentrus nattereri TaxID=42514 RepID=A0AAR2IGH4_PYGNA|nr:selenocysteine insertion sequence-binding protein 2 isoform X2 [Pygocentrus nattereri]